jgi:hypothetical protein
VQRSAVVGGFFKRTVGEALHGQLSSLQSSGSREQAIDKTGDWVASWNAPSRAALDGPEVQRWRRVSDVRYAHALVYPTIKAGK